MTSSDNANFATPPVSVEWPFGCGCTTREAVATYLLAHQGIIRRRIVGKLRRAGFSGVDPDDVQSTVIRRIDAAMARGTLRTTSEREFWAFVSAVTDNAVLTILRGRRREGPKLRPPASLDSIEVRDGGVGTDLPDAAAAALLRRMIESLRSEDDRELVALKLSGAPYAAASAATGRSQPSLRTRWATICRDLRDRFTPTDT